MFSNNNGGLSSHSTAVKNHRTSTNRNYNNQAFVTKFGITVGQGDNNLLIINPDTWVWVRPGGKPIQVDWWINYIIYPEEHADLLRDFLKFESGDKERAWVRVEVSERKGKSFWVQLERSL